MEKEQILNQDTAGTKSASVTELLAKTEFYIKECYDRMIILEAKMTGLVELSVNLRDIVHAYLEVIDKSEEAD